MRHHEIDIVGRQLIFAQHANRCVGHRMDGAPENHLSIKVPQRVAEVDIESGIGAAKAAHPQTLSRFRVATQHAPDHPFFVVRGLQHDCGRAVAEKHGNVAIAPVHVAADQLHTNHDRVANHPGSDHCGGCRESVTEAGTRRVEIDRRSFGRAQCELNAGRAVGHEFIVAHAAVNNQVDLARVEAGAGQRAERRDRGKVDGADVRNATFAHTRARSDPFV